MKKSANYDPYKLYKGFGTEHTIPEWSKALNIRLTLVKAWLTESHESVERLAEALRATYDPSVLERKPREGARMAVTRRLVEELLRRSGYAVNPGDVTVKLLYNTSHAVDYNGERIGKYDYKTKWLGNLFKGGALPLAAPYSESLKIQRNQYGRWDLTPESRAIISRQELKFGDAPEQRKYDEITAKHKETPKEDTAVLYEYKGRKATCTEWSRRLGIPVTTLWRYLNKGLTIDEALERFEHSKV